MKFLDRLKLQLRGYVYIGEEKHEGWSGSLPFYLFKCPKHGLVKSYAKGHKKRLECPECLKEERAEAAIWRHLEATTALEEDQSVMETVQ